MARLGVAAQVICVATVSNERGFSDMKLHMMRLRSSLGVEMLEHLMRMVERALNHWSGLTDLVGAQLQQPCMLESIQNEITIQGGKSKAKKPKRKAKASKAKSSGD
jgi:hypothetical protein